jgi:hypothetical protein
MAPLLQTVLMHLGVDVTDRTRRNAFTSHFGFSTNGNFTQLDQLLQPGGASVTGAYVNLVVPAQAVFILTAASTLTLAVTWSSPAVTKIFNINQMMFISDMTDVTALQVVNTAAVGATPESVRILLF